MSPDTIICDWNGTLIEYPDERPVLENTARDVFRASFPPPPFPDGSHSQGEEGVRGVI